MSKTSFLEDATAPLAVPSCVKTPLFRYSSSLSVFGTTVGTF